MASGAHLLSNTGPSPARVGTQVSQDNMHTKKKHTPVHEQHLMTTEELLVVVLDLVLKAKEKLHRCCITSVQHVECNMVSPPEGSI